MKQSFISVIAPILVMSLFGCGSSPPFISSKSDIDRIPAYAKHLSLGGLAAEDVPALAKFKDLSELDFEGGASDEHLEALGAIELRKLTQLVLTSCPKVTDRGVAALLRFPTLKGLGLRGTSVGDEGCVLIAERMKLQAINLPDCPNVTAAGLVSLARSSSIEEIGFSARGLKQEDLIRILSIAETIKRVSIHLPENAETPFDLEQLRSVARNQGIELFCVENLDVSRL